MYAVVDKNIEPYDYGASDDSLDTNSFRKTKAVEECCLCGLCDPMPSKDEIDAIIVHYHTCREDFEPIVMLHKFLWTALVALHDRESRSITRREAVPNKYVRIQVRNVVFNE